MYWWRQNYLCVFIWICIGGEYDWTMRFLLIQGYMKIQNTNEKLYFSVVNIARSWTHVRSWFQVSKVSWHKDSAEPTRTLANVVFVTLSLAKRLTWNGTSLASWYCDNTNKQCDMVPERKHYRNLKAAIVLFRNHLFSLAVSTQTTYISLWVEQPTSSCIVIFNKHCCYIKYGGIITNLTLWNPWGYITDMSKCHGAGLWSQN